MDGELQRTLVCPTLEFFIPQPVLKEVLDASYPLVGRGYVDHLMPRSTPSVLPRANGLGWQTLMSSLRANF
ncbi:MAG: hypothetical protein M2R45_01440 [Verrucomicrobia subdivision 3 bacterium]|nr:hypothetical protein [Limisphaerales bacterium]MCS1417615.1 hypothetical protein [Limisphaerales bacterium]